MRKRAIITRITGQDGSYLAELLLKKGYTVLVLKESLHLSIQVKLIIFLKIQNIDQNFFTLWRFNRYRQFN